MLRTPITQTTPGQVIGSSLQHEPASLPKVDYATTLSESLTAYMRGGKAHWEALQRSQDTIGSDSRFLGCLALPSKEQWQTGQVEVKLDSNTPEQVVELLKLLSKGHSKNSGSNFFKMLNDFIKETDLASETGTDAFFKPLIKRGIIISHSDSPKLSEPTIKKLLKLRLADTANRVVISTVKKTQQWAESRVHGFKSTQKTLSGSGSCSSLADSGYLSSSLSSIEETDPQAVEAQRIEALLKAYNEYQQLETEQLAIFKSIIDLKPLYQLVSQYVSNEANSRLPVFAEMPKEKAGLLNQEQFMALSLNEAERRVSDNKKLNQELSAIFTKTSDTLVNYNDQLRSKPLSRVLQQGQREALIRSGEDVYTSRSSFDDKVEYLFHPNNKRFDNTFGLRLRRIALPQSEKNKGIWNNLATEFLHAADKLHSRTTNQSEETVLQELVFDDTGIEQLKQDLRKARQANNSDSIEKLDAEIKLRQQINRVLDKPAMDELYTKFTDARNEIDRYADTWINKVLPKRFKIETADYQAIGRWLTHLKTEQQKIQAWLRIPYQEVATTANKLSAMLDAVPYTPKRGDNIRFLFSDFKPTGLWQRALKLLQPKPVIKKADIQAYVNQMALIQGALAAYPDSSEPLSRYVKKAIVLEAMLSLEQKLAGTAQYPRYLDLLEPYRAYQAGL